MAATPRGRVHPTFVERITQLQSNASQQAQATIGARLRPWQIPQGMQDLLDIPNLHTNGFDRSELNTNYLECVQDPASPGTTADVISLQQQIDYNAMEERAFRIRHATLARCLCHSSVRRFGHGSGRPLRAVAEQAANILAKGSA